MLVFRGNRLEATAAVWPQPAYQTESTQQVVAELKESEAARRREGTRKAAAQCCQKKAFFNTSRTSAGRSDFHSPPTRFQCLRCGHLAGSSALCDVTVGVGLLERLSRVALSGVGQFSAVPHGARSHCLAPPRSGLWAFTPEKREPLLVPPLMSCQASQSN